ncbi:MAG: sugar ABC transporter ATP-binding protein [Caldilineaceae bacterium]
MTFPSAAHTSRPVLAARNIVKNYPGVRAVDNATLELWPGEVHGLVGENGAGKSTLIKILAGAVRKDAGELFLNGEPVTINNVQDAYRLGLAFIHQELNLVPYFDGAENIYLGHPYPHQPWGGLDRKRLQQRAAALLTQLGAQLPVNVPVSRLSPGQQTMISIARAFAADASIIVMDEPTAALTDQEISHLYTTIQALRTAGKTVVYVSHRLQEIFDITDRVTVMRNGQVVVTAATQELDRTKLIQYMTGREGQLVFPAATASGGQALLTVRKLTTAKLFNISFTLQQGEVLGVAGLVGAGRTELLRALVGADPILSGEILLHEQPFQPHSPADALRRGVALAPEERRSQGLILKRPIFENVTLTHLDRFAAGRLLLNQRRELGVTEHLRQALHLKASNLRAPAAQLSGGNQQKVVIARCLGGEAAGTPLAVLLLDEPTRGVDVGAKHELYQIIRDLTARGVGVLLVSSELPELLGLADRILVLHEGRQVALVDAKAVDQGMVLHYCYGVSA